jgi:peroxiredoxin
MKTAPIHPFPARDTDELTPLRIAALVAVSVVVWLFVAMFIRFGGAAGRFSGWKGVSTYAATVAFTPPLNALLRQVAGVRPQRMATVGAVAVTTPPLLEGIAMKWFPVLYGGDPAVIQAGAVWLLWAIGVGLGLSVWTQMTATRRLEGGAPAPAIRARSTKGAEIRIPDPQGRLTHVQFLRFAGCPVCNLSLREYIRRAGELSSAGVREIVLFHSEAEFIEDYHAQLPFDVIADPQKRFYKAYGVEKSIWAILSPLAWPNLVRGYRLRAAGALDSTPLGLPADVLVGADGRIVDCHNGSHSSDQWTVDDVLRLAREQREPCDAVSGDVAAAPR